MSTIHKVITENKLDVNHLFELAQKSFDAEIICEERGSNVYYFWVKEKSTRGMDITLEDYGVEIRNTGLSNKADLMLTNIITENILKLVNGELINEDDEKITQFPLYSEIAIKDIMKNEARTIFILSRENNEISIFGPIRKTYFGRKIYEALAKYEKDEFLLSQKMEELILKSQYHLPDYSYGNILQAENGETPLILKLLTNKADYIIDKYDYILVEQEGKNPIIITNDDLNKILPASWSLIDEYTVVAPVVPENEWEVFVKRAKSYDTFDDFMKNGK